MNTGNTTVQNLYHAMSAEQKHAFDSIMARVPADIWTSLNQVQKVVANALLSGDRTADELTHLILTEAAQNVGKSPNAEFGWGLDLAYLILFGERNPHSRHAGQPATAATDAATLPPIGLGPTTDPDEIEKRMMLVPPVYPDGTIGAVQPGASAASDALVDQHGLDWRIARYVSTFPVSIQYDNSTTWEEFCSILTAPRGLPSGETQGDAK